MTSVLAVGDSLTSGHGLPVAGLTCRSWAAWLAWALVVPLSDHTVDGATTRMVVRDQLPLAGGPHRIAVTVVGANDVVNPDPETPPVADLVAGLLACADLVLVGTLPRRLQPRLALGPGGAAELSRVTTATRAAVLGSGATLLDLTDQLPRPFDLGPDGLHPSALGHLCLARAAAAVLLAQGVPTVRHLPDPAALRPTGTDRLTWAAGRVGDAVVRRRARRAGR